MKSFLSFSFMSLVQYIVRERYNILTFRCSDHALFSNHLLIVFLACACFNVYCFVAVSFFWFTVIFFVINVV